MVLVVDTETHDLPRSWRAPVTDLGNWPRVVQVAWIEFDASGEERDRFATLVRPDGFTIREGAHRVHGITTARAARDGIPVEEVLDRLTPAIERSNLLVAHNIDFDATVLSAEFLRAGMPDRLRSIDRLCTMKESASYCRIPGPRGPKWPRLEELHTHLFSVPPAGMHDALADAEACARCFFELRRRGVPPFAGA